MKIFVLLVAQLIEIESLIIINNRKAIYIPPLVSWNPNRPHGNGEGEVCVVPASSFAEQRELSVVFGKHARSKSIFNQIILTCYQI